MRSGLFFEAAAQYEEILKRDPKDADASAGLLSARKSWLDCRLIEARMTRLAGSVESAGDILLEILDREKTWSLAPSSREALTQQEETRSFAQEANRRIQSDLEERRPLRAEFFLEHYALLLQGEAAGTSQAWKKRVREAGKKDCRDRWSIIREEDFFFRRFLTQYCAYWGAPQAIGPMSTAAPVTLYKDLDLRGSVEGLELLGSSLAQELQTGFKQTAWQDPSSVERLTLQLSGRWTETHHRSPTARTHVYKIKEPFTQYVQVEHERAVPHSESRIVPDSLASRGTSRREVTEYRMETYTTTEPRIAYREVDRYFTYTATLHDQRLALEVSARSELGGIPIQVRLSKRAQAEGLEHHENQPGIGLTPEIPRLLEPGDWLRARSHQLSEQLIQELSRVWTDRSCGSPALAGAGPSRLADSVLRCARQARPADSAYPSYVEAWFQDQFGLQVRQVSRLIPLH